MSVLLNTFKYDQVESVSINPIKVAPGLGAGYAVQGFRKAIAFYHAAPGCNFLSKVLLTQHFMEPVATAGSDIKETALIFGGTQELQNSIEKFCEKSNPEIVFILSSSIPEIRAEEYSQCLKYLEKKYTNTKFIVVSTPDFQGSFSEGYAKLVHNAMVHLAKNGEVIANQVNLLPAPYMTAGDIDELRDIIESFGLNAIVIPDISSGPDGSKEKFSSMSMDGTSIEQLQKSGRSLATFSFGKSSKISGDFLYEKFSIPHIHLNSISGLQQTDLFIQKIMQLKSGMKVAHKYMKERARLKDIMIDTHLILNNKNVALALEYDHAESLLHLFKETGIRCDCAISPLVPNVGDTTIDIQQGTLYDIEEQIMNGERFDALITNTHGKELSQKYDVPLIRAGFPVTDRYGMNYNISVGYKGAIYMIRELANTMAEHREKK